jgi:hypothetical protein
MACGSLADELVVIGGKHAIPKITHPELTNPDKAVIEILLEKGLSIINTASLRIREILYLFLRN